jgi:hypothetical protein
MKVWFSLQGEMNLAVMSYPGNYSLAMGVMRAVVTEGWEVGCGAQSAGAGPGARAGGVGCQ